MNHCKDCKFFTKRRKLYTFLIGHCAATPFAIYDMSSDDFAIPCGDDGPIIVGEEFGCVNFKNKEENENSNCL